MTRLKYDLATKHHKADRLRNYKQIGDHQATFYDAEFNTYRGTANIVDYFWEHGVYFAVIEWNGRRITTIAERIHILAPAF